MRSRPVQLSLLCLLAGVGIATVTDLELNYLGTCLSLLAILTTCIAQIMTNTIQKRAKLSSTQLLYQTSPVMAATLLLTGPFLDRALTGTAVFGFDYTRLVTVRRRWASAWFEDGTESADDSFVSKWSYLEWAWAEASSPATLCRSPGSIVAA